MAKNCAICGNVVTVGLVVDHECLEALTKQANENGVQNNSTSKDFEMEILLYNHNDPDGDPLEATYEGDSVLSLKADLNNGIIGLVGSFDKQPGKYRIVLTFKQNGEIIDNDEMDVCYCDPHKRLVIYEDDICACEYCKTVIPRGGADEQRGAVWSCEKCGVDFCEACTKEKHGAVAAHEMFSNEGSIDDINCPECFGKNEIDDDIDERICTKCKSSVFKSDNPNFAYRCKICNKDLHKFKTKLRPQPIVEGSAEVTSYKGVRFTDEMCAHCSGETFNIPVNRMSLCAHCGAEMFPCAGCEGSSDGPCSWTQQTLRCNRFNHSKEHKAQSLAGIEARQETGVNE